MYIILLYIFALQQTVQNVFNSKSNLVAFIYTRCICGKRKIQCFQEVEMLSHLSSMPCRLLKCYCQRKPGMSKRSRSAFDLHLFTIGKPPEKIINGGIFRSWWVFYLKIKIFLKAGPFTGMKCLDFRPTFVEPV